MAIAMVMATRTIAMWWLNRGPFIHIDRRAPLFYLFNGIVVVGKKLTKKKISIFRHLFPFRVRGSKLAFYNNRFPLGTALFGCCCNQNEAKLTSNHSHSMTFAYEISIDEVMT